MAPSSSKHYPITTGVFSCIPSSSGKPGIPASFLLDPSTSLAHLGKNHVDSYLKQIIRHLKNLVFKKLPDVVLSMEWSIFVLSQGAPGLNGKLMHLKPSSMLEALTFLNLSFLHSQNFLTNITQFCKAPKIDEPELSKLKKLQEHLVELTGSLDKILMYFHVENTSNLPSLKDFKRMLKKLGKAIRKIKPQSFNQFTPITAVTEEDILCSVLGLQHDVADHLRRLNPDVRSHQSDMYFLQYFLADKDVNSDVDECLTNMEAVSSKLQEMGFTQSRSVAIADWIAKQPWAEHKSLLAWAQHYIESLFTYDIFLTECVLKYPYEEKKVDEWFSVSVERVDNDEDGVATNVQVINLTTHDGLSKSIEEKKKQYQQQPGQRLYYHGTDHNSVKSILEDGIKLEKGNPCCDFSNGKGFYVADDAMYAFDWAKKSKAPALVMFTITDECLNRTFKGLDLSSADRKSDWEVIKNYFRKKDKKLSANRKLRNECNKSDYIKGPISRDGTEQNRHQNVQQICIRNDEMAEDIGSLPNICGVVFINAN